MTQYCQNCNHEFAPEDQNCANCGRPRPPVIQKKYAQILSQAEPEDETKEAVTQPYTVLPAGLRSEAPVQVQVPAPVSAPTPVASSTATPAPSPVAPVAAPTVAAQVSSSPVATPAPAKMETTKFTWALPDEAELKGNNAAKTATVDTGKETTDTDGAEKAEPELPTFWTCPQCVSLNPSSVDYCENCGALKPNGVPENRVAASNPNAPASSLPVPPPPPPSNDPDVINPVQQGPDRIDAAVARH